MSKNIEHQYLNLLQDILDNGVEKQDRTGTGTISIFGKQIRHDMQNGFPLLTTKRMPIKIIATELKWFLKGDTNIKYLVDNGCNIWNGDAYKKYKEAIAEVGLFDHMLDQKEFVNKIKTSSDFAIRWGELGPIYGKQWVNWGNRESELIRVKNGRFPQSQYVNNNINQIANLINDLKTNPDSRRLMVNAWNVGELDQMTLPPCHYGFQVYTRELSMREQESLGHKYGHLNWEEQEKLVMPTRAISLMWNQRSVDTFLGLPFNIASYGLLLEIIAKEVNMVPDELIGNLGDTHLYKNHIEQAKEQLSRQPMGLPKLHIENVNMLKGEFEADVHGYSHHEPIKAPLSN